MEHYITSSEPVRIRPFVMELFAVKWWWVGVENRDRRRLLVGVFMYQTPLTVERNPSNQACAQAVFEPKLVVDECHPAGDAFTSPSTLFLNLPRVLMSSRGSSILIPVNMPGTCSLSMSVLLLEISQESKHPSHPAGNVFTSVDAGPAKALCLPSPLQLQA